MSKLHQNSINHNPSDGEGWAANYKAGKVHAMEDECDDQYQMLVWRGPFHDVSGCDTETAQDVVDEAVGKGGSLKKQMKRILKGKWLNDKLSTHYAIFFQRRRNRRWSTPSWLCGVWAAGAGPPGASAWTMAAASRTRTLSTSSILTTLKQNSSPYET